MPLAGANVMRAARHRLPRCVPSVTATVVTSVERDPPNADIAATSETIAIRTTTADPFRNVLKKPS